MFSFLVLQRFYHQQNQLRDKQERRNKEADDPDPFFSNIPKYRQPYSSSPPVQTYQYIPVHPAAQRQQPPTYHQPLYSVSPPIQIDQTPPLHNNPFINASQIPTAHQPHQTTRSSNQNQSYLQRHASEQRATNRENSPKHQFFYNTPSPIAHRRSTQPPNHQSTTTEATDPNQLPPLHPVYGRSPPDRRVYPTPGHPVAKSIIQSAHEEPEMEPKPPGKGADRLREDQGNNHT